MKQIMKYPLRNAGSRIITIMISTLDVKNNHIHNNFTVYSHSQLLISKPYLVDGGRLGTYSISCKCKRSSVIFCELFYHMHRIDSILQDFSEGL